MRSVLYWLRIGGLAAAMMAGAMLSNANGDVIVTVDLSVVDRVTFSATSGTSLASVSGDIFMDDVGVYFKNFLVLPVV